MFTAGISWKIRHGGTAQLFFHSKHFSSQIAYENAACKKSFTTYLRSPYEPDKLKKEIYKISYSSLEKEI